MRLHKTVDYKAAEPLQLKIGVSDIKQFSRIAFYDKYGIGIKEK